LSALRAWDCGAEANNAAGTQFPLWEKHLHSVSSFYHAQRDAFVKAAEKHLVDEEGQPLAEYVLILS